MGRSQLKGGYYHVGERLTHVSAARGRVRGLEVGRSTAHARAASIVGLLERVALSGCRDTVYVYGFGNNLRCSVTGLEAS